MQEIEQNGKDTDIFTSTDYLFIDDYLMANDGQIKFLIPSYQRNFSWERSEVINLLESIDEVNLSKKESRKHIGHIILDPSKKNPNECFIVDGQQRSVVISLLLLALLRHDGVSQKHKNWIEKAIFINKYGETRIEPKSLDMDTYDFIFRACSNSESPSNMEKCYTEITKYLMSENFNVNRFAEKIRRVTISYKIVQPYEDARIIYADMNSKSHKMTDFDLMRCYVLYDDNQRIVKKFDKIEELLDTRDNKKHANSFFKYYVEIKANKSVTSQGWGVYKEFKSRFPENDKDLFRPADIIDDMKNYAEIYNDLFISPRSEGGDPTSEIKGIIPYVFFDALVLESLAPFFMRLIYEHKFNGLPLDIIKKITATLTATLVRGSICGDKSRGSKFEDFVCGAYQYIKGNTDDDVDDIPERFKAYISARYQYSDEEVIRNVVENERFYTSNKNKFLKLILSGIEYTLNEGAIPLSNILYNANACQVDHIIPENADSSVLEEHSIKSKDEFDHYKNRIGNLSFLSPTSNQRKGNKGTGYYHRLEERFRINKYEEQYGKKDLNMIRNRTDDFAKIINQTWPDPYKTENN